MKKDWKGKVWWEYQAPVKEDDTDYSDWTLEEYMLAKAFSGVKEKPYKERDWREQGKWTSK